MIVRGKMLGVIESAQQAQRGRIQRAADLTLLSILGQIAATALDEMQNRIETEEAQSEEAPVARLNPLLFHLSNHNAHRSGAP